MRKLLALMIVMGMSLPALCNPGKILEAKSDERIELVSIICHLAGFGEYNMDMGGEYIADIDSFFAPFKKHPAVEMMKGLKKSKGVSFDSPMSFALYMQKDGDTFSMVSDSVVPEKRWKGVDLKDVTSKISDFYRDSDFKKFFNSHKPFYDEICKVYNTNVLKDFNGGWYEKFYGFPPMEKFEVIIGFTNGGANYGPSRKLQGQPREVYSITGYSLDEDGETYFKSSPDMYLSTLVHEFNHSFVNPLLEDTQFSTQMEPAGKTLLDRTKKIMYRNNYGNWQTIINESVVRAAVIQYLIDNGYPEDVIRKGITDELSTGFYWIPELVECLSEYTSNRDKYPTFNSFYGRIVDFFNDYTSNMSKKIDNIIRK